MTNLFGHSVRSESLFLYLTEAAFCFAAVFLLLTSDVLPNGASAGREMILAALLALATGVTAAATGLHNPTAWRHARQLSLGALLSAVLLLPLAAAAVVLTGVDASIAGQDTLSVALLLVAAGVGAAVLTRLVFFCINWTRVFSQPIAVLGLPDFLATPVVADGPAQKLAEPYRIAVHLRAEGGFEEANFSSAALREQRISLVVAAGGTSPTDPLRSQLQKAGLLVVDEVEFLERQQGRVDLSALQPGWLRTARGIEERPVEAALRRAFDIVVSLALLLLTLPLTLLAVLAIRIDSPGPVFYRQDRVGKDGSVFSLMKLRSMRVDAEAAGAPQWATQRDSRVTRVGRILRLTRIDEIPQVLNVLRGDMAFIGPRPERPAFVETLAEAIPFYNDRAVVKPGITGWAQVNFPYGASIEDARQKLSYDLYYVRRRSLFLDLLILVGTVRVILFQEGSR